MVIAYHYDSRSSPSESHLGGLHITHIRMYYWTVGVATCYFIYRTGTLEGSSFTSPFTLSPPQMSNTVDAPDHKHSRTHTLHYMYAGMTIATTCPNIHQIQAESKLTVLPHHHSYNEVIVHYMYVLKCMNESQSTRTNCTTEIEVISNPFSHLTIHTYKYTHVHVPNNMYDYGCSIYSTTNLDLASSVSSSLVAVLDCSPCGPPPSPPSFTLFFLCRDTSLQIAAVWALRKRP